MTFDFEPQGGDKHDVVPDFELQAQSGEREHHDSDRKLARRLQEAEWKNAHHPSSLWRWSKEQMLASLEPCQLQAIHHVQNQAKQQHGHALSALCHRITSLSYSPSDDLDRCLTFIREDAPIVIHLKEESLNLLVNDTHYRNQFETKTAGGTNDNAARAMWEGRMFGTAYDGCRPFDRPKYGCLNLTGDIKGFRDRTTFFGQDSGSAFAAPGRQHNESLATNEYYAHVLQSYTDVELKAVLGISRIGGAPSTAIALYKEVQIHGPVCLATDIQALSVPGHEANAKPALKNQVHKFQKLTGCNVLWQDDLLGIGLD